VVAGETGRTEPQVGGKTGANEGDVEVEDLDLVAGVPTRAHELGGAEERTGGILEVGRDEEERASHQLQRSLNTVGMNPNSSMGTTSSLAAFHKGAGT